MGRLPRRPSCVRHKKQRRRQLGIRRQRSAREHREDRLEKELWRGREPTKYDHWDVPIMPMVSKMTLGEGGTEYYMCPSCFNLFIDKDDMKLCTYRCRIKMESDMERNQNETFDAIMATSEKHVRITGMDRYGAYEMYRLINCPRFRETFFPVILPLPKGPVPEHAVWFMLCNALNMHVPGPIKVWEPRKTAALKRMEEMKCSVGSKPIFMFISNIDAIEDCVRETLLSVASKYCTDLRETD